MSYLFPGVLLFLCTVPVAAAGYHGPTPRPPFDLLLFCRQLEKQLEMDSQEHNSHYEYLFYEAKHFPEDLVLALGLYWESRSLPQLWEAARFPNSESCIIYRDFAREYSYQLDDRIAWGCLRHMETEAKEALTETKRLVYIWARASDAAWYWNSLERRRALGELRELLGDDAYYAGQLPEPFPRWFMEVRP